MTYNNWPQDCVTRNYASALRIIMYICTCCIPRIELKAIGDVAKERGYTALRDKQISSGTRLFVSPLEDVFINLIGTLAVLSTR